MSIIPALSRKDTLHVRDTCLCLHAQRAARALARHFDDVFRPLGLTNGQFSLMMSLNRPEPPSLGQLANALAMDRTTLTAALKPLTKKGLVVVQEDKQDRRSRRPSLTPQGHALLVAALPLWTKAHAQVESLLGLNEAESLRHGLRHLISTCVD